MIESVKKDKLQLSAIVAFFALIVVIFVMNRVKKNKEQQAFTAFRRKKAFSAAAAVAGGGGQQQVRLVPNRFAFAGSRRILNPKWRREWDVLSGYSTTSRDTIATRKGVKGVSIS